MKNKFLKLLVTTATIVTPSYVYSAEYMMCTSGARIGVVLPEVKNGKVTCEGKNFSEVIDVKLADLRNQGWKVDQMTSASDANGKVAIYYLMMKD